MEGVFNKIMDYVKDEGEILFESESYLECEMFVNDLKDKANIEICKEIINGLYGNGNARKSTLEKLGYNYKKIQAKVNQMLRKKK